MTLASRVFLFVALLGALLLCVIFAIFGFVVASGGIKGRVDIFDATLQTLLIGTAILVVGTLPLALSTTLAVFEWKRLPTPKWLWYLSWIAGLVISGAIILDIEATQRAGNGYGFLTFLAMPFTAGLLGALLSSRRS